MQPKDLFIGFLSNLIRNSIAAAVAWLAATHPAVAHIVSSSCPELVVQVGAAALAAIIVSLVGAWMRVLRHNELIEAAYQEGVSAATGAAQQRAGDASAALGNPKAGRASVAILSLLAAILTAGCLAPVTVNVFSSRMVNAVGTNATTQAIEGGATVSSNNAAATIPVR